MHDAVPAARPRGLDIGNPVVHEHRRCRLEREPALGLLVDPLVRLRESGLERGQRAVTEAGMTLAADELLVTTPCT